MSSSFALNLSLFPQREGIFSFPLFLSPFPLLFPMIFFCFFLLFSFLLLSSPFFFLLSFFSFLFSFLSSFSFSFSKKPKIGLSSLIAQSISHLPRPEPERLKKYYQNIILVGGGANLKGLPLALQIELQKFSEFFFFFFSSYFSCFSSFSSSFFFFFFNNIQELKK